MSEGEVKVELTSTLPGTQVTGTSDVVYGHEWAVAGVAPGGSVFFDAVLSVSGTLDSGQSGSNTDMSATLGFGFWDEDPGSPDGFIYLGDWASFSCDTGNLGPGCLLDEVDASGLTVTTTFLTIDLSGQVLIPNLVTNVDPNGVARTATRLALWLEDDLSTSQGVAPASVDFTGTITVDLVPQDPGVTITAIPPQTAQVPMMGAYGRLLLCLIPGAVGYVMLASRSAIGRSSRVRVATRDLGAAIRRDRRSRRQGEGLAVDLLRRSEEAVRSGRPLGG